MYLFCSLRWNPEKCIFIKHLREFFCKVMKELLGPLTNLHCLYLSLHVYTELHPHLYLCSTHWTSLTVYLPGTSNLIQSAIHYLSAQNCSSTNNMMFSCSKSESAISSRISDIFYWLMVFRNWDLGTVYLPLSCLTLNCSLGTQFQQWDYWITEDEIFYGSWFNIDKGTTSPFVGPVGTIYLYLSTPSLCQLLILKE